MSVKTIAILCSSAAAITSSSLIEPPGWITAVAPASAAASIPSLKGTCLSSLWPVPMGTGCQGTALLLPLPLGLSSNSYPRESPRLHWSQWCHGSGLKARMPTSSPRSWDPFQSPMPRHSSQPRTVDCQPRLKPFSVNGKNPIQGIRPWDSSMTFMTVCPV